VDAECFAMRQLARGVRRDGVPHGAAVSARPDRWLGFLAASRSQCLSLSDYVTVTGPRGWGSKAGEC